MHYVRIPALGSDALTPYFDFVSRLIGYGNTFKEKALHAARIQPQESVLDIGSGTASLLILAKRAYPHSTMFGIEPDQRALHIAQKKIQENEVSVGLIAAGAEYLPLPASTFDVVISTLVFHHFPTDVKKRALREIHRVLKPDSRFLLADFGQSEGIVKQVFDLTVARLRLPEVQTIQDNVAGKLPIFLREAGFEIRQAAPKYRGIQFWQATKFLENV